MLPGLLTLVIGHLPDRLLPATAAAAVAPFVGRVGVAVDGVVGAHLPGLGLPLFGVPIPVDVDVGGTSGALSMRLGGELAVAVAQVPDVADLGVVPLRLR